MQIWAFRNGSREGRNLKEYSWAWDILVEHGERPNYQSIGLHLWPSFHSRPGNTLSSMHHSRPAFITQLRMAVDGLARRSGRRLKVAAKGVAVDLMAWATGSSGSRWRKRRRQRCWEGGDAPKSVADGLERANRGRRRQPLPCSGRRRRR